MGGHEEYIIQVGVQINCCNNKLLTYLETNTNLISLALLSVWLGGVCLALLSVCMAWGSWHQCKGMWCLHGN